MKAETFEMDRIKSEAELKAALKRLVALLDDPQPGLYTWCLMYGRTFQSIVNYWDEN